MGASRQRSRKTTRISSSAHFDPAVGRRTLTGPRIHGRVAPLRARRIRRRSTGSDAASSTRRWCVAKRDRRARGRRSGRSPSRRLAAFRDDDSRRARDGNPGRPGTRPVREGGSVRVTVPSWRVDIAAEDDRGGHPLRGLTSALPAPFVPRSVSRAEEVPTSFDLRGDGLLKSRLFFFVEAENGVRSAAPGAPVSSASAAVRRSAPPVIGLLRAHFACAVWRTSRSSRSDELRMESEKKKEKISAEGRPKTEEHRR